MLDLAGCSFRAGLAPLLAFGCDRRPEAGLKVFREFIKLGVAVDFDGLLRGVTDNVTVVAPSQVLFQFGLCTGVHGAVQVVSQFAEKLRALHWLLSPLRGLCDPSLRSLL